MPYCLSIASFFFIAATSGSAGYSWYDFRLLCCCWGFGALWSPSRACKHFKSVFLSRLIHLLSILVVSLCLRFALSGRLPPPVSSPGVCIFLLPCFDGLFTRVSLVESWLFGCYLSCLQGRVKYLHLFLCLGHVLSSCSYSWSSELSYCLHTSLIMVFSVLLLFRLQSFLILCILSSSMYRIDCRLRSANALRDVSFPAFLADGSYE